MEKDKKQEYEKPELVEHENLNKLIRGGGNSNP